ncbi:major capsid protein [Robbsia andropogonis]|uniref:major capsid protein n=1 Tax=Robbsia andropogonis TaxID=28092 RepID=UPI0004665BCC|nr:major capsid protein [Robbsia andropogonis]
MNGIAKAVRGVADRVNGVALRVGSAVAAGAMSVAAHAQSSSSTNTIDTTSIVGNISGAETALIAVATAIIGVGAVMWGYKRISAFIGR